MESISARFIRCTSGNAVGDQRQQQRRRVGHHMPGVSDQRQRAGQPAADSLDGGIAGGQQKHPANPPDISQCYRRCVAVAVMLMWAMVMAMSGMGGMLWHQ